MTTHQVTDTERDHARPVLAMGDGALGFWKAVRDLFPDTKEQRCWWHKIGNVPASLLGADRTFRPPRALRQDSVSRVIH